MPSPLRPLRLALALLALMGAGAFDLQATSMSLRLPWKSGDSPLFRVMRQSKWGFMNRSGRIVIPLRYDHAEDFFDGLAAVRIGDTWGYITETGRMAIPPRFERAESFEDGVARVSHDDGWGLIDTTGQFVVASRFEDLRPFSEGLASFLANGRYGFVDRHGRIAIEPRFLRAEFFVERLAAVVVGRRPLAPGQSPQSADSLWAYIDTRGEIAIGPRYGSAESFHSGVAVFWSADTKRYGLIDRLGQPVGPADFTDMKAFTDGLAFVEGPSGTGFLTTAGTFAFMHPSYWCLFADGLACLELERAGDEDPRFAIVDTTGAIVIPGPFEWVGSFQDGLCPVTVKGKTGYIDRSGKMVIAPRFTSAHGFTGGLAIVAHDGVWSYIDRRGRIVLRDAVRPY